MRILYVTPYVPSKIRVRPYNFIKSLAKRHSVSLIALAQSDMDRAALPEMRDVCDRVKTVDMSVYASLFSAGKGLLSSMPLQAAYTYLPKLLDEVDRELTSEKYDVLHVEHIRAAHSATHVKSLPKVYDSVDCITLLLQQMLESKRNPFAWLLTLEEWAKMRVYEGVVSQQFGKVITTSETDKDALDELIRKRIYKRLRELDYALKKHNYSKESLEDWRVTRWLVETSQDNRLDALISGSSHVSVIPNGVDFDFFQPMEGKSEPNTIVFSGKMSYYANAVAVKQFHDRVYPIIKEKNRKVKFKIVGYNPPPSVRKLAADPSVTVTGYVDDIRPHLASATAAVCPISVGVGIQNKVVEAMAMGKPVICSSIAKRAIKAEHGKDLMCADTPEDFAEAVLKVLASPDLQKDLGERAVDYVHSHHSWDEMSKRLEDVYRQADELFERQNRKVA